MAKLLSDVIRPNGLLNLQTDQTVGGVKTFTQPIVGQITGSAGGVAWADVSSRPTALSSFTNDLQVPQNDGTGATGTWGISITGTASLADSGVTAGTYNSSSSDLRPFTVDQKGRITSIGTAFQVSTDWASLSGKPTTIAGFGITDAFTSSSTYTGTISSGQVTTALGFTPYNSTNPSGYITSSSLQGYLNTSNYGGYQTFSGTVSSGSGFTTATYSSGARNPIWRFGNADGYGLSYFQSTAGIGGADTIGLHFGTATAAASHFAITPNNGYINSNVILHAGNYSSYAATSGHGHNDTNIRVKALTFTGESGDSGNGSVGTNYGIYQQGGAWSSPFPDLCIGFYTGIKIGAYYGYNGTRFYNNSDWATQIFSVGDGDNNVRVYGDIRAPIYYDSNNTGYYIDAASTSTLYKVNINNNIEFTNYGRGIIGTYASTRYQAVFAMGSSYMLPDDGTTTGTLYGLAWSHPNAGGVAGNLNTHGMLAMENGAWLASVQGSIRCRDDMRAPIYYDSNDTAYYCDPNGGSRFNATTTNEQYTYGWFRNYETNEGLFNQANGNHFYQGAAHNWTITGAGGVAELCFRSNHQSTVRGYVYGDTSSNFGLLNQNGQWKVRVNGSETEIYDYCYANDIRTYIMYDRNDTGYYTDPNSTSSLNTLYTNNHYIRPGAMLYSDHGSWTGEYNKIQWHSSHLYLQNAGGGRLIVLRRGDGGERFTCDYDGNVVASGNITAYSDVRLKTNIVTINNPLDIVKKLRGVTFDWIESGEHSIGLIAQEVEQVLPCLVMTTKECSTDPDSREIKQVDYQKMVSVLIEAIKDQQKQIEELKKLLESK